MVCGVTRVPPSDLFKEYANGTVIVPEPISTTPETDTSCLVGLGACNIGGGIAVAAAVGVAGAGAPALASPGAAGWPWFCAISRPVASSDKAMTEAGLKRVD